MREILFALMISIGAVAQEPGPKGGVRVEVPNVQVPDVQVTPAPRLQVQLPNVQVNPRIQVGPERQRPDIDRPRPDTDRPDRPRDDDRDRPRDRPDDNRWRYRWHQGAWHYFTPSQTWVIYRDNTWIPAPQNYVLPQVFAAPDQGPYYEDRNTGRFYLLRNGQRYWDSSVQRILTTQ